MAGRTLRRLLARRDRLVPPAGAGGRDLRSFAAEGDELLIVLCAEARLLPDHAVVDVGCGYGRVARPLARFLTPDGSYLGIDVDPGAIAWCRERYAEHGSFAFEHVDAINARYRPDGAVEASTVSLPAGDRSADVVVMASVLAHLVTAEAGHYLREAARILRPGGRALLGLHLLDLASRAAIARGDTSVRFDLDQTAGPMAVVDPELPEEAVAFDHRWVDQQLAAAGLRRVHAQPGSWRGGLARTGRDLLVCERV